MHKTLLPLPANGLFLADAADPTGNGETAVELCGMKGGEIVHTGFHVLTHGLNPNALRGVLVPANVSTSGLFEADASGLFLITS